MTLTSENSQILFSLLEYVRQITCPTIYRLNFHEKCSDKSDQMLKQSVVPVFVLCIACM